MLPRRHTLLCLTALVALAGCKTKPAQTPPAPVTPIGANHGGASGQPSARHSERKDSAPAPSSSRSPFMGDSVEAVDSTIKIPGTNPETSPENAGAALRRDDALSAPPESPREAAPTQPSPSNLPGIEPKGTNLTGQPTASSLPSTTPSRIATSGLSASSPAKPAPPARLALTIPPAAPAPPRPVARLTLAESPLPAPTLKNQPRPVSLSGLITGAPTPTPAPARLSAVIPAPSLADVPPTRTQTQPLDLFSRLITPPVVPDSAAPGAPLSLPLATAASPIPTARFDQPLGVSLPDTPGVTWQTNRAPAPTAPALSNWVPPVAAPPPPASTATREDRDTLHRKVYQFLLGQP